jgi:branched-chain amino acid transport system ATP-binding protein
MTALLSTEGVTRRFGGLTAVDNVTLSLNQGRIGGLIGPNGAGKTTLFAMISGFTPPDQGRVYFDGAEITGLSPHEICDRGLVRTFQIVQPFAGLSVLENIAVGSHRLHVRRADALAHARQIAQATGMTPLVDRAAATLTVAGRKRLELARALATQPKMILLDEVMAGLNPTEIEEIIPVIRSIRDGGVTILLIEHVMAAVMQLAEELHVLSQGKLIASGAPAAIAADPVVIEAYLGEGAARRIAGKAAHA